MYKLNNRTYNKTYKTYNNNNNIIIIIYANIYI
jgi:hypothetical protein